MKATHPVFRRRSRSHRPARLLFPFLVLALWVASCGPTAVAPELFGLPTLYSVGKKPATILAHDINNDEYPDLLVPNTQDNTVMFFEGNGDGSFKDPLTMKTGREPVAVAAGDFNGDGISDFAVCNYGDDNLTIILSQKDGVFKIAGTVRTGKLPIAIAA